MQTDGPQCQRCGRYDLMTKISQYAEGPFGGRDVHEFLCQACGYRSAFVDDEQEVRTVGDQIPQGVRPGVTEFVVQRDRRSNSEILRGIMGR